MKINITKCLIALTLALLSLQLTAQVHVDNQWKNIINPIFDNLDKSKIQSGILLDYAMEFTDVTAYNVVKHPISTRHFSRLIPNPQIHTSTHLKFPPIL